jgi:hypothetical protein
LSAAYSMFGNRQVCTLVPSAGLGNKIKQSKCILPRNSDRRERCTKVRIGIKG